MQIVPLKLLTPHEKREFKLNLVKNTNPNDIHNNKQRGNLTVELTFIPFKEESERFSGPIDQGYVRKESVVKAPVQETPMKGAGLLLITVLGAEDVEGKHHTNPCALILFRGEKRKTKVTSSKISLIKCHYNHGYTIFKCFNKYIYACFNVDD